MVSLSLTEQGSNQISIVEETKAAPLVELLNAVIQSLDPSKDLEDWFRRCLLNALIQITKRFGCYPTSLSLPIGSVNDLEEHARGGFGCVYKGTFRNRVVAVKELLSGSDESSGESRRVRDSTFTWITATNYLGLL